MDHSRQAYHSQLGDFWLDNSPASSRIVASAPKVQSTRLIEKTITDFIPVYLAKGFSQAEIDREMTELLANLDLSE